MDQQKTVSSQPSTHALLDVGHDVHARLEDFTAAIRAGDLDKIMAFYSDDVVAFDMMPPLRFEDKEKYRETAWQTCFVDAFKFPVEFKYLDSKISVTGDLAFVHSIVEMMGEFKKGGKTHNWLRSTIGLRKIEGQWMIVHEHNSVPIGEDMKALMELNPKSATH